MIQTPYGTFGVAYYTVHIHLLGGKQTTHNEEVSSTLRKRAIWSYLGSLRVSVHKSISFSTQIAKRTDLRWRDSWKTSNCLTTWTRRFFRRANKSKQKNFRVIPLENITAVLCNLVDFNWQITHRNQNTASISTFRHFFWSCINYCHLPPSHTRRLATSYRRLEMSLAWWGPYHTNSSPLGGRNWSWYPLVHW